MKKIMLALTTLFLNLSAFAQEAGAPAAGTLPPPTAAAKAPGTFEMLIPFVGMFAIMYFLMIRPQQKRAKEQANMLGSLKAGDEVLTTSGILGKVSEITDKVVTVEVDRNVKVRMLKTQVAQIMPTPTT